MLMSREARRTPSRVCLQVLAAAAAVGSAAKAQTPPAAPPPSYGGPIALEAAARVAAAAEAEAKTRHVAVTIAIVDSGGNLVLEHRMDGASLASVDTAPAKAKSAVMWQRPTASWASVAAGSPAPLSLPHVIISAGGELIVSSGKIVGAVGVGGSLPNEGDIAKMAASTLK
jgi:uncharacterized protein GlcG (DUF336 family)